MMSTREEVLHSLVESVESKQTEGIASTLGALAVGSALVAKALSATPDAPTRPIVAVPLARKLAQAGSRAEELEAVEGLLIVCARSMIRLPDHADLGHRVRQLALALAARIGR